MGNAWITAGRRRGGRRKPQLRSDDVRRPPLHTGSGAGGDPPVGGFSRPRAVTKADPPPVASERFLAGVGPLISEFESRLRAADSPLVTDVQVLDPCLRQVSRMLAECLVPLRGDGPTAAAGRLSRPEDCSVFAAHDIALVELMRAFEVFTELATRLLHDCVAGSPDAVRLMSGAVLALQRSVAARVEEATVSYDRFHADRVAQARAGVRRRIAREMHDHVGNGLSLAYRHLEMYEALRARDSATAHRKVTLARDVLTETQGNIRRLVSDVRVEEPVTRVVEAVENFVAAMDTPGTVVDVRLDGEERWISERTAGELYTVIRETLRNAFRHAHAARLAVRIGVRPHEVRVSVQDDGAGFDTSAPHEGHGLASMAERVDALGGELAIRSQPGMGTRVHIRVPLSEVRSEQTG